MNQRKMPLNLRAEWHTAKGQVRVHAPIGKVWELWSDLEKFPHWQPWLHSVKYLPEKSLSKWTLRKSLAGIPLEFSWVSRADEPVLHELISWEAVSGLKNKGRVEFQKVEIDNAVDITMTIEYKMPRVLSFMLREKKGAKGGFVSSLVQRIIKADLRRFKFKAESLAASEIATSDSSTQ